MDPAIPSEYSTQVYAVTEGILSFFKSTELITVDLHRKLTRDLHLKLTRLDGLIMAVMIFFFQSVYPPVVLKLSV